MRSIIIKENEKLNTTLFLLILSIYLGNFYINVGFSLKPYMIVFGAFLLISMKNFSINKLMNYEVAMLLFYLYYCTTGIFSKYPQQSLRLIFAIVIVVLSYFIMKYAFIKFPIMQLEKAIFTVGILYNFASLILYILGLISVNFNFFGNGVKIYGLLLDRNIPRLVGLSSDPNIFTFSNVLFLFFFMTRLSRKHAKLGFLLTIITSILAFSRAGLIAITLGLLVYLLFTKFSAKIRAILLTIMIGFISYYSILKLTGINLISILSSRFESFSSGGGSGRYDIWENGLELFLMNPLTGIGIYNFLNYNISLFGDSHYMHNTFLEVLIESGVIGAGLFLLFWFSFFIKIISSVVKNRLEIFILPTFVSMTVLLITLSLIANEFMFMYFAIFWRYLIENELSNSNRSK